ncbi:unnamed protein product [Phytomonas sp. Hart1]|nr:unnamed protein product [Phytomonas sp. Hart1]|eukprot:CCW68539.1 unnamed protein product [Phytomonas sp. isolate Hart1]
MSYIHICRHGQDLDNAASTLNGHRNQPLSALGEKQAQRTAENILKSGIHLDAIYSSPLRRAQQTAEILRTMIPAPLELENGLIERDFGALTGRPYSDIPKLAGDNVFQGDKVLYFLEVDGCETFPSCLDRARRVLARLDAKHSGQHVLLVCHGDIGKMLIAARRGITWQEALQLPYFENTEVISI